MLFEKATLLQPNYLDAHYNLGNLFLDRDDFPHAINAFLEVIRLCPQHAQAHYNLGNAYRAAHLYNEAASAYSHATKYQPSYAEAFSNLAGTLLQLGRPIEAFETAQSSLKLDPTLPSAHWNLAYSSLLLGNFPLGWAEHEWRWACNDLKVSSEHREFSSPLWLGKENISGKTILLHAEQGLGDTIQFSRYVNKISELGGKPIIEVQAGLAPLLQTIDGAKEIYTKGDVLPLYDYHCPLLSLPLAFNTQLDTIPSNTPYVTISSNDLEYWSKKVGGKDKNRIGIAWCGNPSHQNDHNRSIPLDIFSALFSKDFEFICLQNNLNEADVIKLTSYGVKYFGSDLKNFVDTGALCELTDLVISVDTSIAHLAGALNKPTWLLLPSNPDWRWLENRSDSPWYPSMQLFRQEKMGGWTEVLNQVSLQLAKLYIG